MWILSLVEKEEPLLGGGGQQSPGSLYADVLHERSDADQESERHYQPPEPRVLVRREVGRVLHDERPLGERQAEPGQSTVSRSDRVTETRQHQKADPVE